MAVLQIAILLAARFIGATLGEQDLVLALEDDFSEFNLSLWKHEITLAGGGNWEFQAYLNNRSSSYVRDGVLYIKPILMEDQIGVVNVMNGFELNVWGGSPADYCTKFILWMFSYFRCWRKYFKSN